MLLFVLLCTTQRVITHHLLSAAAYNTIYKFDERLKSDEELRAYFTACISNINNKLKEIYTLISMSDSDEVRKDIEIFIVKQLSANCVAQSIDDILTICNILNMEFLSIIRRLEYKEDSDSILLGDPLMN